MSKYKMISYLFLLLGVLIIVGSAYLVISYASDVLGAIVDFVTTNDFTKLHQCGITPPAQFAKIKADLTTVILPFLYVGIPLLLIFLSFVMFQAGFYFHRGKHEDDARKSEELEKEMVHKLVKKMEAEKAPSPPHASSRPQYAEEPEETSEEEVPPEEPESEAPEEEEPVARAPPPKFVKKRR